MAKGIAILLHTGNAHAEMQKYALHILTNHKERWSMHWPLICISVKKLYCIYILLSTLNPVLIFWSDILLLPFPNILQADALQNYVSSFV